MEYPYSKCNSLAIASDFDAYPGCSRGLPAGIHGPANIPEENQKAVIRASTTMRHGIALDNQLDCPANDIL